MMQPDCNPLLLSNPGLFSKDHRTPLHGCGTYYYWQGDRGASFHSLCRLTQTTTGLRIRRNGGDDGLRCVCSVFLTHGLLIYRFIRTCASALSATPKMRTANAFALLNDDAEDADVTSPEEEEGEEEWSEVTRKPSRKDQQTSQAARPAAPQRGASTSRAAASGGPAARIVAAAPTQAPTPAARVQRPQTHTPDGRPVSDDYYKSFQKVCTGRDLLQDAMYRWQPCTSHALRMPIDLIGTLLAGFRAHTVPSAGLDVCVHVGGRENCLAARTHQGTALLPLPTSLLVASASKGVPSRQRRGCLAVPQD